MSELKTVSLSRIARKNLVNHDDATIYHNDKILVFRNYSVFDESHFGLRNSEEILEFPSNQRLVSRDLFYFNNLFNLPQM